LVLRHKDKGILKVDQLSDGIKNMLAMVADIAYRCSHLNSHFGKDAAKLSKGIVLIDEVDMHLHPKWQQTVIEGLTNAFPNIQFIVTTHSPQVLSTIDKESIRIIREGKVVQPAIDTRGEESKVILEDLMHVPSRPKDTMSEKLKTYLEHINRGNINSRTTQEQRKELEAHYASHSQL
uniref:AAA family ATPase n=1 Tax=Endozoicomonas sp. SESOKO2 TaxID=2828743 RepID=UPI002147E7E0